jgi:hypothetical protein
VEKRCFQLRKYISVFLFSFVLSPGMIDDCGSKEIAGCKLSTPNFPAAGGLANFMSVSYYSSVIVWATNYDLSRD